MSIDLSALLQRQDATEEFVPEITLEELEVGQTKHPVTIQEPMKLVITNLGSGKINIQYSCRAVVAIPCARCLKPVDQVFDIKGECEAKLNNTNDGNSEEDTFFIEKTILYPELLLADEILMQWPIRVLCKADCKGICSRCGADLNIRDCGCDRKEPDLRMAAIKDIFSQFKEV